jgi:hypothetical protein
MGNYGGRSTLTPAQRLELARRHMHAAHAEIGEANRSYWAWMDFAKAATAAVREAEPTR